eukprot:481629_1
MDQLIRYSQNAVDLDDKEFMKLTRDIGRDRLQNLMFNGLHNELQRNLLTNLKEINEMISKIQESRIENAVEPEFDDDKDMKPDENQSQPIHLADLASVIISEISSYLQFTDVLHFEKCNRSIFIGSRSSTTPIHTLDDVNFMKLTKFCKHNQRTQAYVSGSRRFKSVSIVADHLITPDEGDGFIDYKWGHFGLFRSIQELEIQIDMGWHLADILREFNQIHFGTVKTFRLLCAGDGNQSYRFAEAFVPFMNGLDSLEHFEWFGTFPKKTWFYQRWQTSKELQSHLVRHRDRFGSTKLTKQQ